MESSSWPKRKPTASRNWKEYNKALVNRGSLTACFPPRQNAIRHKATDEAHRLRNHAVLQVGYHNLKYWKKKNNYHRRSLAETAMFRFKQLLGDRIQAHTIDRQAREIGIKCLLLNKITQLRMPTSEMI